MENVVQVEGEPEKSSPARSIVQQTIETMESSQLCIHPVHRHSFSPVNFLLSVRKCAACEIRLKPVFGGENRVVRCLACGVYAHRSCAMSASNGRLWAEKKCTVNSAKLKESETEAENPMIGFGKDGMSTESETAVQSNVEDSEQVEVNKQPDVPANPLMHLISASGTFLARGESGLQKDLMPPEDTDASAIPRAPSQGSSVVLESTPLTSHTAEVVNVSQNGTSLNDDHDDDDLAMIWTRDGPPQHWANTQSLSGVLRPSLESRIDENTLHTEEDDKNEPLHIADNKFESVARALQENIIAHFIRRPFIERSLSDGQSEVGPASDTFEHTSNDLVCETSIRRTGSMESETDMNVLLTEVEPKSPEKPRSQIAQVATGTYEVAKTTTNAQKKMGLACVAGGIAGGVAGLVLAGPAGAVIGAKAGQTAGLLGVILEGTMTVGVIVAGVAAGGFTGHMIKENQDKRVLAIGEDGIKRKVLLVRPNIWIDPVWEKICADARASSPPPPRRSFGILPSSQAREAEIAKRERYLRDADIVQTDEMEIPTSDKVLLLVSRSLNNKQSLPGHVYKCLIQKYRERCEERGVLGIKETENTDWTDGDYSGSGDQDARDSPATSVPTSDANKSNYDDLTRARRQDTHAVIKHVTATLLEVRPGFAASPVITEMSATSVEGLVFGELYESVFEEILVEAEATDDVLLEKIADFEKTHSNSSGESSTSSSSEEIVSQTALDYLRMLPEAHSAYDKLHICVQFLEEISGFFASQDNSGPHLCADSLLKIVCQHIIAAKVPHMNAEIAFLEEFARDEQLLRGKEGYALVTLQASLHFLNGSADFDADIFEQHDEDDQAVPSV